MVEYGPQAGAHVTESRRLRARVAQEDRIHALGTMAASVAHEINNPLTYVLGGLEEVRSEVDGLEAELGALSSAGSGGAALTAARGGLERLREILGPTMAGIERIRHVTRELSTFTRPNDERLSVIDVGLRPPAENPSVHRVGLRCDNGSPPRRRRWRSPGGNG